MSIVNSSKKVSTVVRIKDPVVRRHIEEQAQAINTLLDEVKKLKEAP